MIAFISKRGTSFKGAMAYYLHDKRADFLSGFPTTAFRVAWTEMRNLCTQNPHLATKIMIATASMAHQLKQEAGIKPTGRQSKDCVYSYSLSWHKNDAVWLNKELMIKAADETLEVLKAQHLQSVIVCHTDQPHPHVHVVVNRVNPWDGRLHSVFEDRTKLVGWAIEYEQKVEGPNRQAVANSSLKPTI